MTLVGLTDSCKGKLMSYHHREKGALIQLAFSDHRLIVATGRAAILAYGIVAKITEDALLPILVSARHHPDPINSC